MIVDVFKKTAVVTMLRGMSVAFGFAISVVLASKYPASVVGSYFYIISIIQICSGVSRLGTDTVIVRQVGFNLSQRTRFSLNKLQLIYGLPVLFGGGLIYYSSNLPFTFLSDIVYQHIIVLITIVYIENMALSTAFALRGYGKPIESVVYQGLLLKLLFVVFLVVAPVRWMIDEILFGYIVIYGLVALSAMLHWKRVVMPLVECSDIPRVFWIDGFHLLIPTVVSLMIARLPLLVLGTYAGMEMAAVYGIVTRIASFVPFVAESLNIVSVRKFSRYYVEDKLHELRKVYSIVSFYGFLMSVVVSLVMVLTFDYISVFFGEEYLIGREALYAIIVGQIISSICGPGNTLLVMCKRASVVRNNAVISAIVIVLSLLILVPLYGMNGAAVSSSIALVVYNLLAVYKLIKIGILKAA